MARSTRGPMGAILAWPAASCVTTIPSRTSSSGCMADRASKGNGACWYGIDFIGCGTFIFDPRFIRRNAQIGEAQKIGENGVATACQNRFRVELHAEDGPLPMRNGHDDSIFSSRGDLQIGRQ